MLMSVLSRNHPASMPAKQAGYAYIAQFGAICRMQHLPPEHGERSQDIFSWHHLWGRGNSMYAMKQPHT